MMKASLRDGLGMAAARDAGRANSGSRIIGRVGGYGFAVNGGPANNRFNAERTAALIAWMLVVRIGDLVKDGAISAVTRVFDALWRRRLRRSSILDKITNTNRNAVQAIKAAIPIGTKRICHVVASAGVLEESRANQESVEDAPVEIIPLGPGFAAELRGVTLADVAADDAVYAAV